MYRLTVILACQDPAFQTMIRNMLLFDSVGMKLTTCASSPEDLIEKTHRFHPDLVIWDWDLSSFPPPTVANQVRQAYENVEFLFVSNRKEYDQVYQAIRLHAANFILLPIAEAALKDILNQTVEYICGNKHFLQPENNAASRYLFMKRDINQLRSSPKTIEQVNAAYGTRFSKGLYRAFIIKMDCPGNIMSVFENDMLRDKIIQITRQHLSGLCYDILFDKLADSVLVLYNYDKAAHDTLQAEYNRMFEDIKTAFRTFQGIVLTMCISREYDDFSNLPETKFEALDARWARNQIGTNKIISASELTTHRDLSVQALKSLHELKDQVIRSFQILDPDESREGLEQFFASLKSSGLGGSREARVLVRSLIDALFEMYGDTLAACEDVEAVKHEFIYLTNMASSLERLQKDFIKTTMDILSRIMAIVGRHYSRPVLLAIRYIRQNFQKTISLNEAAAIADLTPTYFSSIFKKETGMTFSQYTVSCKLDMAKKLLETSDANISEIAEKLGYADSRYFTKTFRKQENMSPTEYRKLIRARATDHTIR